MESLNIVRFTYSQILDRTLSEMAGNFDQNQVAEARSKMFALAEEWHKYEARVIAELKKYPPYKFDPKVIKCYLVKNLSYTGISDPLIMRIEDYYDLVMATLIHELVHVAISQEENNLIAKIKQEFPEITELKTQLHVVVNFIEYQVLKELFDPAVLDKIMKRNLSLRGIKAAWDVVLANEDKLKQIIPISQSS